jgi:7-cyano-7-deazaguanine synthase
MKTVLLFSGGLDSTTLLYDLIASGDDVVLLSVNYGQRHRKELEFAAQTAARLGLRREVVDISGVRPLLNSSQTSDKIPVPDGHYNAPAMKATVVPSRNLIMLSIAIAWAQALRFDRVAYAAHAGDHEIYPDCRPAFVDAVNAVAALSDYHGIALYAPYVEFSKAQITLRGDELGVPYAQTWSCYKGLEMHCGTCGTCTERREAFMLTGVPDPTEYVA